MRIIFDQGVPVPLRRSLEQHLVETVFELGWSELKNGDLLEVAEQSFDLLVTTDQQIKYQQNLAGRRLAILVLSTSWPRIRLQSKEICDVVNRISPGDYIEVTVR